jgi:hypothetical protein
MTTTQYTGAYLPVVTGDTSLWGGYLNTRTFVTFDAAIGGIASQTLTNADVTLTAAQSGAMILSLNGALAGNRILTTLKQGICVVENYTTGNYTVTYTNGTGASVVVPQGVTSLIATDATGGAFLLAVGAANLATLSVSGTSTLNSIVFDGTTYTFGAGASSALRNGLELSQNITANGGLTIDVNLGFHCVTALTGNVTYFAVSNWPAAGTLGKLTLDITSSGSFNISSWPGTTRWTSGTPPTLTPSGQDTIVLTSADGTNFRGYQAGQSMS